VIMANKLIRSSPPQRYYEPRRGSADPRDAGLPPRPSSPPRYRRPSPVYDPATARRRSPEPRKDEATALLDEIDSETRSVFVSQLAAALTSRDLGLFFEDKLGRGSVRDSRVVTDRVTRRSKGWVVPFVI
jgi:RNA-binding protein 23/39